MLMPSQRQIDQRISLLSESVERKQSEPIEVAKSENALLVDLEQPPSEI
jgi:hypothetical protein